MPVAYMQLDDWWYEGPFYIGNVKAVVEWRASRSPKLFPSGLQAFADRLNLPLQLYTPFWSDKYMTPYNVCALIVGRKGLGVKVCASTF